MTTDAPDDRMAQWRRALLDGAADLGISIPPEWADAFRTHFEMLLLHNPRAGLTTITDPVEIAVKHFLDSLAGLLVREIRDGERVADVGSGGGFPGAVFAAALPQARYTLIESNRRRAAFLRALVDALGLENTAVIAERAEQTGRDPGHRGSYDLVLSRAVAPLRVLLEYCLPLAAVGGHMLAYKGPEAESEVTESADALSALGGRVTELRGLSLPQHMGERVLVLIQKTAPTPDRYPRRPGTPAKRPL
jgi:16S rRNA (guanine527-N7)-methyltransferase